MFGAEFCGPRGSVVFCGPVDEPAPVRRRPRAAVKKVVKGGKKSK